MGIQNGIWTPSKEIAETSTMAAYMRWLSAERGLDFPDYDALWQWSITDPDAFWRSIWDYNGLTSPTPFDNALAKSGMPGAVWFPGATLNYVDQVLRHVRPGHPAIHHEAEVGTLTTLTWDDLAARVGALAASLRAMGIETGDRVVGYLPNTPDTIVAFLACASIGATWSLCAPDMGAPTVLERFRQIEPKAIFTISGYDFTGKWRDRSAEVQALLDGLPTLAHWITLDAAQGIDPRHTTRHGWADLLANPAAPDPVKLPFDHPLWVVYSSGTTGSPKPIVHGHGGIVLEHLVLQGLHGNLGPDDTFCWFTSTGWIMWNAQVAGLLTGATIALAEGNPNHPDAGRLWRFIDRTGTTSFGAGAAWFIGAMKSGVKPHDQASLETLRAVGSTGSPLPPEAYEWIWSELGDHIWLSPIAGGTDFAGAFLAGNPMLPVRVGEMQCRALGAAVEAFDDDGNPLIDEVGELVCTVPMPSMPLYFWGDEGDARYRSSYFETYPGVWRHGDWVKITPEGGAIIYGRSDATINRHGIRMGTADIYRVVEDRDAVADSLVVDLEYLGRDSCMILFLKLAPGASLTDDLRAQIVADLKSRASPRHVPDLIETAPDIPYTLTGKKMEVPIKKRLLGQPMAKVATPDAMANPGCLDWYDAYAERYLSGQG
ncbi:acetoacetate--CoA ligase [Lutimaribacter saemankumensis]|uniref:Acetoacetyl-CoA synthetase n=1 Tax=Lutimaribacter saemankumensis TaxID=490829 RepID=A0A1G8N5Q7_9RHOB|nr:acetoacetate--CoA ligase [Lutimaribacter saemankumensis]SDI75397.1 acetoacetyl-CoA synthetase [Lutimaribacter saemankumensis]